MSVARRSVISAKQAAEQLKRALHNVIKERLLPDEKSLLLGSSPPFLHILILGARVD